MSGEFENLTEVGEDYTPENCLFVKMESGQSYSHGHLRGPLIRPDQVLRYKISEKIFSGHPKINITILMLHDKTPAFRSWAEYVCPHTGEEICTISFSVDENTEYAPEWIARDETGRWKKPTPQSIETELVRARKRAGEGNGFGPDCKPYKRELRIARHWAEIIDYEIEGNIEDELKDIYHQQWIKNYQNGLEKEVDSILTEYFDDFGTFFGRDSGYERLEILAETLPQLDIKNPKTKQEINRIFQLYEQHMGKMFEGKRVSVEEKKRELEEELADAESAYNGAKWFLHLTRVHAPISIQEEQRLNEILTGLDREHPTRVPF